jgi:hypothetical protein
LASDVLVLAVGATLFVPSIPINCNSGNLFAAAGKTNVLIIGILVPQKIHHETITSWKGGSEAFQLCALRSQSNPSSSAT